MTMMSTQRLLGRTSLATSHTHDEGGDVGDTQPGKCLINQFGSLEEAESFAVDSFAANASRNKWLKLANHSVTMDHGRSWRDSRA